jgi:peptidoglycan/LPS O-acetylase OafA/YrhL
MGAAEPSGPKYAYIDALRGYAVLMVITCHTGGLFSQLPYPIKTLTNFGVHGVQLFFLISCVTLIMSWKHDEVRGRASLVGFWTKRFFRIAPMYYLAGVVYFFIDPPSSGFDLTQMLTTASFINAWSPVWIPTVPNKWMVVPGGWSIGVEFTFYLIFPLVMLFIISLKSVFCLFAASVIGGAAINIFYKGQLTDVYGSDATNNFVYLSFPNQFHVFVLGGILYLLIDRLRAYPDSAVPIFIRRWTWPVIAICVVAGIALANLHLPIWLSLYPPYWPPTLTLASLMLMLFVSTLAMNESCFAVNRLICLLGKVSFSAYLVHSAVLHKLPLLAPRVLDLQAEGWRAVGVCVLLWLVAVPVTLGLSYATFSTIEAPMIGVGRRLVLRRPSTRQLPA